MKRLSALLSAMFLTSALATPALASSSDTPSCGGDKGDKKEEKKGSSFVPSCGEDKKDKKDTTKS